MGIVLLKGAVIGILANIFGWGVVDPEWWIFIVGMNILIQIPSAR